MAERVSSKSDQCAHRPSPKSGRRRACLPQPPGECTRPAMSPSFALYQFMPIVCSEGPVLRSGAQHCSLSKRVTSTWVDRQALTQHRGQKTRTRRGTHTYRVVRGPQILRGLHVLPPVRQRRVHRPVGAPRQPVPHDDVDDADGDPISKCAAHTMIPNTHLANVGSASSVTALKLRFSSTFSLLPR